MTEYDVFSSDATSVTLVPCSVCSRTFMPETLVKHEKICSKSTTKQRKVFQSGKQRATGSDVPLSNVIKSGQPPSSKPNDGVKKNNWRAKHEELVQGLRAARGIQNAIATGKPLPPPPPPAVNADYVQCPSCQRRFNESAAERHITFCKEKNKRLPDKKEINPTAQRRQEARVNYKTAKPRIKGREDTMHGHHMLVNGFEANGYSAPMRTGRSDRNDGLNIRSGSLEGRKPSSGDSRKLKPSTKNNRHDSSVRAAENDNTYGSGGMPSATSTGRPPSGSAYQHRSREGSARSAGSGDGRRVQYGVNQPDRANVKSKFCHECGNKYCRMDAKFCCECGCQRMIN